MHLRFVSYVLIPLGMALVVNSAWLALGWQSTGGVLAGNRIWLGQIVQGDERNFDFEITNRTNQPIQDLNVEPSCGCTVLAAQLNELPVGATTQVNGRFVSAGRRGLVSVALLLTYRVSGERRSELLNVDASIIPKVSVRAEEILINRSGGGGSVVIESTELPFEIENIGTSRNLFDTQVISLGANAYEIRVLCNDSSVLQSEADFGRVDIKTNITTEPVIKIPIRIEAKNQ